MYHPEGPTFLELMRQALASTERGYDLIAPKFDVTPFRTPEEVVTQMAEAIGAPRSIASALDVCCGTGASLAKLRALCTDRVVGYDFSQGMLDEAARRLENAPGDAKVEFRRGDALALPYENEFDVVTSVGAFGHIEPHEEDRFLDGIVRALKPGGRFVFGTSRTAKPTDRWWWMAKGFNGVMRVRNALIKPPFIMYYLTFQWPDIEPRLRRHGLSARQVNAAAAPWVVVVAEKK